MTYPRSHSYLPYSSDGKESACNAGEPGSIPGSGRSSREGISNSLPYSWPGESHGQRSLAVYRTWGGKELDTTEQLTLHHYTISERWSRPAPGFWCPMQQCFSLHTKLSLKNCKEYDIYVSSKPSISPHCVFFLSVQQSANFQPPITVFLINSISIITQERIQNSFIPSWLIYW